MRWLGVAVESYHSDGRLSAFGGHGYTPEYDQGVPAGPTFAAGGFTFVVSAGAGHAFGVADRFLELLNLGLGYTWRRP